MGKNNGAIDTDGHADCTGEYNKCPKHCQKVDAASTCQCVYQDLIRIERHPDFLDLSTDPNDISFGFSDISSDQLTNHIRSAMMLAAMRPSVLCVV